MAKDQRPSAKKINLAQQNWICRLRLTATSGLIPTQHPGSASSLSEHATLALLRCPQSCSQRPFNDRLSLNFIVNPSLRVVGREVISSRPISGERARDVFAAVAWDTAANTSVYMCSRCDITSCELPLILIKPRSLIYKPAVYDRKPFSHNYLNKTEPVTRQKTTQLHPISLLGKAKHQFMR